MIEAGRVTSVISADISGLQSGVRQAADALRKFESTAQRSLERAMATEGLPPAMAKGVREAVARAKQTMSQSLAGARDSLAQGIIGPEEFKRRAAEAGQAAAKELEAQFGRMASMGLIPPAVAQRLKADLTHAAKEAGEAAGTMISEQLAARLKAAGSRLKSVGNAWTLGVSAPLAAFGVMAVRASADFEKSMNRVGALSGAAGAEIGALREQAKKLGAETQYSASQAADAMGFLAMAGFKANEILSAMPSTLQLAAAASMDIAHAADITSNILTGFGLPVEQLGRANDVLVRAFTRSNTDLRQLGEALKYVGPLASGLGVQFEEVVAAIGMFGNAGIQASMAGTSLRRALSSLANPTRAVQETLARLGVNVRDSNGALISLASLLSQLERSGADASDMMILFGDRGGPAIAALLDQGSDALRDFTRDLEDSAGVAGEIAESQMRGFSGAVLELKSAFEGLQIAMTEQGALAGITGLTRELAGFVRGLSDADQNAVNLAVSLGGVAIAAGPVVRTLGAAATGVAALGLAFGGPVAIGAGLAATAVGGLATMWLKSKLDAAAAREEVDRYTQSLRGLSDQAEIAAELDKLLAKHRELREEFARTPAMIEPRNRGQYGGASKVKNPALEKLRADIEQVNSDIGIVIERSRKVGATIEEAATEGGNAIEEGLTKPTRETASALSRLTEQVVRFQSLRSLGIPDFDAAPRDLQQAADAAIRLQSELSRARADLALLGSAAPAGTQEYLAALEGRARRAEVATRTLARTWESGLQRMQQVRPEIAQSILPDLPSPATAAAQYEQRMREIREQMARGLMQPREFEEAGRAAGEAYKAALLETLDQLRAARAISPEIEADIIAKLTPLLNLDPATREFGSAATEVGRGLLNVADSFGAVDEKTRRAATGLNEIAAAAGQIKGGGLLQAGNIGALMGLAGGIAQTLSGALGGLFGRGREDQQRTQELAQAVRDLRAAVQGMRGTGEALAGAVRAAGEFRATPIDLRAIYQLPQSAWGKAIDEANAKALNEALLRTGITLEQLEAAAQAAGLSIYDQAGKIDYQKLRTAEFAEALALATQQLVGFRSTLSDQRQRQSIEDKLFGRPTDAAARLANQMELLEKFMPEFAAGLRGIDTSTAEGRARLLAEIQRMWTLFASGVLDLEKLTREEWLDLIQGFADAFDSFRDAADRAAGALLNVPALFDLALRRRQSAMEFPGLPGSASPVVPGGDYTGGTQRRPAGDVHVHIHNPPAGMDVEATRRQVKSTLRDDPEARVLVRRAAGRY